MWLCRIAIARPRTTIALGLAVAALAVPGVLRLRLRTDGHALVPTDAVEVLHDRQIRAEFGVEDPLVILIRTSHSEGIYNVDTLQLVENLTAAVGKVDGVRASSVFSLATEHGDRVWPGTLKARRFLEPFPSTSEEISRLRADLDQIGLYTGTLISRDASATCVMVGVPEGDRRSEVFNALLRVVSAYDTGTDVISVIGPPFAEALLGIHILEDLGVPAAALGHRTRTGGSIDGAQELSSFRALQIWVARHIGLLPVALAVMAAVFLIAFRSVALTAISMLQVGAALVFVLGVMGYVGVPVYLTTPIMPVILTVAGVTDEIHVFSLFRVLLRRRRGVDVGGEPAGRAAAAETMDELWKPVLKTSITTALGFLSFALSPIDAVVAFGVFTALGLVFSLCWSLTVIPASLSLFKARGSSDADADEVSAAHAPSGVWERWAVVAARQRWVIISIFAAFVLLSPLAVRRVRVQDSWISGFAPDSGFYRDTQFFNAHFLGTHVLQLRVVAGSVGPLSGSLAAHEVGRTDAKLPVGIARTADELVGRWLRIERATEASPAAVGGRALPPWQARITQATTVGDRIVANWSPRDGSPYSALLLAPDDSATFTIERRPFLEPATLRLVEELETFLRGKQDLTVGGVIGPATFLTNLNFMTRARDEKEKLIPNDPARIDWLWNQYERIRGAERRRQVVRADYQAGLVTVFMKDANFADTRVLMDAIRVFERERLAPHGLSLTFAGDVAVSQAMIRAIVATQVRSVVGSVLSVLVTNALLSRSILWALIMLIPCSFAVLLNFSVMGLTNMPLGVATSMFTAMTLGIGDDYAIHFVERYRRLRASGEQPMWALRKALAFTGRPIALDALAVAAGLGVMMLSQVPANARLGGLIVLSMIGCLVSTLGLLPAIIAAGAAIRGPSLEDAEERGDS